MTPATTDTDRTVAALVRAASVVVAVSIESLAALGISITGSQLRLLLIVHEHGHANLTTVAAELGVHLSSASRACDALVAADLLHRRDAAASRRNLALSLTDAGHTMINTVMASRRDTLTAIFARMPTTQRAQLAAPLEAFAEAATGTAAAPDIRTLQHGWTRP
jgi:DNA-binding MarR family transcriptional regulator